MKNNYQEIKKIFEAHQLILKEKGAQNCTPEYIESISISSGKRQESVINGELGLQKDGKMYCDLYFNLLSGEKTFDLNKSRDFPKLAKAKDEISEMIAQLKRDLKVVEKLEKAVSKKNKI